ncbi:ANTAR domain-containing response regulator [Maricurvus nonylphenolicus]|uniref:ANTAR domain-containing response regulator n=1 Tax=Maricurvus nonylphenolicus TaxID=1008307 RepID=UPI0036F26B18
MVNSRSVSAQKPSILLFDADKFRRSLLARELVALGYPLVAELNTADYLLREIETHTPDIIVMGIDLPDDDILQKVASLQQVQPHPVVMFAEQDTPQIIQKAIKAGVNAFVVDDIQPERINSIINVAIARFQSEQGLRQELAKTKNQLHERKLIDKAKGLLMKQRDLDEDAAYQLLRKKAMDKSISMAAVAENVIDVMSLMND